MSTPARDQPGRRPSSCHRECASNDSAGYLFGCGAVVVFFSAPGSIGALPMLLAVFALPPALAASESAAVVARPAPSGGAGRVQPAVTNATPKTAARITDFIGR